MMKKENGKVKERMKEKTGPVVDPAAAQQLNMMVLKRYDSDIEEVLANSAHVTLYTLNVDTKTWSRKQVEGSLFLLRRQSNPKHQLMVLNKLSTDNYVETIHDGLDFEVHAPYLMYTHGNDEVVGVWFYERQDLDKVAAILSGIKAEKAAALGKNIQVEASPSSAPQPQMQQPTLPAAKPQEETSGNLQELLFRAHQRHQLQQHHHVAQPSPPTQANHVQTGAQSQQPYLTPPQPAMQAAPVALPVAQLLTPSVTPAVTPTEQAVSAQADKKPMLISPAFFQGGASRTATPSEQPLPSGPSPSTLPADKSSVEVSQAEGNVLQKLFAKAMNVKTDDQRSQPALVTTAAAPTPAAAIPVQPAPSPLVATPATVLESQAAPATGAVAEVATRDKVRQAFARLLQNDAFVDMLASEFKATGLLS